MTCPIRATAIAIVLLCTATISAHADVITVTNTNDSGAGSLRQALAYNYGDSAMLTLVNSIVTLKSSLGGDDGGIYNSSGTVMVTNSMVSNNEPSSLPFTATPTPTITPTPTPTPTPFSHPLRFPPVTTDAEVSVSINEGCVPILDGPCTNMWTYGGTYPGLTIRRPTGQMTNVTFTNNLDPAAGTLTVHNHGNHSSPENDGQPEDFLIATGESQTYTYTGLEDGGNERGTMHFYHDHRMDVNGRNVWMGLTGLYIIDDSARSSNTAFRRFRCTSGNRRPAIRRE